MCVGKLLLPLNMPLYFTLIDFKLKCDEEIYIFCVHKKKHKLLSEMIFAYFPSNYGKIDFLMKFCYVCDMPTKTIHKTDYYDCLNLSSV